MAACSGKFQMIHNFPIRKMKNGGSNQVVLKLIKLRKKRKANEASQSIMLLQAQKGGYQKQRIEETSNDKKVN